MRKHTLCILLAISIAAAVPSSVLAESSYINKQASSRKAIELKDKIQDLKDERNDLIGDLDEINEKIQDTSNHIKKVNNDISKSEEEINNLSNQLNEEIKRFNEQKELYSKRIKVMYINGPSGYLDEIIFSESFSEFISKIVTFQKILEFDRSLLNEMKEIQENIDNKRKNLEQNKEKLLSLRKNLMANEIDLKKANDSKQNYYDSINKDLVNLENMLQKELEESKRIETKIRTTALNNASNENSQNNNKEQLTKQSNQYSGANAAILKASDIGYMPVMTSPFGMRLHPILKTYKMHTGIDYAAPNGTPIYSMADGKVIVSEYSNGYGNYVVIDHGNGLSTLYSHNSSNLVSVGEIVKGGQAVAKMGETGYATGPHVHFEVRVNGKPVNPAPYVIIGK